MKFQVFKKQFLSSTLFSFLGCNNNNAIIKQFLGINIYFFYLVFLDIG